MNIGVPKEIKLGEYRVAMTPLFIRELVERGHCVFVEYDAGQASGFTDHALAQAGAVVTDKNGIWKQECIIKVKEPVSSEYVFLREGQILFSYLHLAGSPQQLTDQLLEKKVTAIAMETVEKDGILNLAAPMSEIAGKMAVVVGEFYLQHHTQGKGVLLDTVVSSDPGQVVVIGAGTAGRAAIKAALARGAHITVFETRRDRREDISIVFQNSHVEVHDLDHARLSKSLSSADLAIGAALLPGARTPCMVDEEMVKGMEQGSVIVDISIDQGGCFATSQVGTHAEPIHLKHGIIHYAVPNMPGAFPKTATAALVGATTPYILSLANGGLDSVKNTPGFLKGLATHAGKLHSRAVGEFFQLPYTRDF